MGRMLLAVMAVAWMGGAVPVMAKTLYSVSRDDDVLRVLDPAMGSTVGAGTHITAPGGLVTGARGLAANPQTGVLWALLKVASCADASRTRTVDACGLLTGNQGACLAAAAIDERGVLTSCTWVPGTGACVACGYGENDATCVDTCYAKPTCADATRTSFSTTTCATFADQASCKAGYSLGSCGAQSCFWTGAQCADCGPGEEYADHSCHNSCGAFHALDAPTLATLAPDTGVATPIGTFDQRLDAIAFTCDATPYALIGTTICDQTNPGDLVRLDPAAGTTMHALTIGNLAGSQALGFDVANGRLYDAQFDTFSWIDFANGWATVVYPLDPAISYADVGAITWSEEAGAFLWQKGAHGGPFLQVTSDGHATSLGTTDHAVVGLAFAGAVDACITCGDGVVGGTEECDDGNAVDGDCCTSACTAPAAGGTAILCAADGLDSSTKVCGPTPIDAKLGAQLDRRGQRIVNLAIKARDAAGNAKKLGRLARQLSAQIRALRKKTAKTQSAGRIMSECSATLGAIYDRLDALVGGLAP